MTLEFEDGQAVTFYTTCEFCDTPIESGVFDSGSDIAVYKCPSCKEEGSIDNYTDFMNGLEDEEE